MIDMRGEAHPGLINLVLFGKASPYYHNGTMLVKDCNGEVSQNIWDKIQQDLESGYNF